MVGDFCLGIFDMAYEQKFRMRRMADRLGPLELMLLDFGGSSTRVVVVRRKKQNVFWDKAYMWPKLNDDYTFGEDGKSLADMLAADKLSIEYGSVITSSGGGIIRLINFPGRPGNLESLQVQVRQALGVDDSFVAQCQLLQELTKEANGREEFSVLSAALPAERVTYLQQWLLDNGIKPVSLRVAGIATANLVKHTPGLLEDGKGVGILELGYGSSMLLIFFGQELVLARQFKFGSGVIIEQLRTSFELDAETAAKFYISGSFDFSANIRPLISPWLHQLGISLDFFERRYGKSVAELSIFGGGAQSKIVEDLIGEHIRRPLVRWNPLDALEGIVPPVSDIEGDDMARFASAAGEAVRVIRSGENKA